MENTTKQRRSSIKIMGKMIGLVKPLAHIMIAAVLLGSLGYLCAISLTITAGHSVLLAMKGQPVTKYLIILVVLAVMRGILHYAEQYCNHFIAFKLLAIIRHQVFAVLRKLCPAKLDGREKGNLISIITTDIELLEVFYAHTVAPIAIGVAQAAGLNLPLTCAAVIGGAYFGDNLSMISDTTISAAKGVGSEMKDKFKMNFFIALPAAIIAVIGYWAFGGAGVITGAHPFYLLRVIPYIVVLIAALMGFNVAGVLFIGIAMTGVIGLGEGSISFLDWVGAIGGGMEDMFSITIVAILISGLIGLIKYYGGVDWLVNSIVSRIKERKGAEYGIGLLSGLLSAALVNNTIAIIISASIAKEIGKNYGIAPKRLASLIDIFACAFIALTPYDGGMLIVTGLSDVSPMAVLKYMFYMFALIITTCITIQFGLLRTKEEKEFIEKNPNGIRE